MGMEKKGSPGTIKNVALLCCLHNGELFMPGKDMPELFSQLFFTPVPSNHQDSQFPE
jgi:hypothetical protein